MGVRERAGGLERVVRLPTAKRRDWVTPSGAASLLECKLRVAYATEGGGGPEIGSPATRLGTACHEVLELAANGALAHGGDDEWRKSFEEAWDSAIGRQLAEVAQLKPPRPWPKPERWPYYAPRKVATKRVARQLSAEVADPRFMAAAEGMQQTRDGTIRGKPDLIVRSPGHEIRDYKTGRVTEEDGTVRAGYALQVQLYAVLEYESWGQWPERGLLVALPGAAVTVEVDEVVAQRAADQATNALAGYNSAVDAGMVAPGFGAPSPAACRYCRFAPVCPDFWSAWEVDWGDAGLAAVAGTVKDVRKALKGVVSIDVAVERGCEENGAFSVHEIDPLSSPAVADLEAGDAVTLVGLRLSSAGHATPAFHFRSAYCSV